MSTEEKSPYFIEDSKFLLGNILILSLSHYDIGDMKRFSSR
jgi:hypothetical protein